MLGRNDKGCNQADLVKGHRALQVHRMKAFSFIRSSLAGGCYQGPPLLKPEESLSGFIPKVPSLLFDLEVCMFE